MNGPGDRNLPGMLSEISQSEKDKYHSICGIQWTKQTRENPDTENRLTAVREEWWWGRGWVKKMKGLRKKPQTDNTVITTRKGEERQKRVKWGQMVLEGDRTWGGEHTIYRWCIIELYLWNLNNFIDQVTSIILLKILKHSYMRVKPLPEVCIEF